jgi:type IV pilus biogenesis protein CpaD/CtpE
MQGLSAESLSNVTDEGDYKFEGTSQELDTACLRPSCTHSSELQQQAQQALDQQTAAEAAKQAAEQQYNAALRDKQWTEMQLQAAEKRLGTAVKVSAMQGSARMITCLYAGWHDAPA